jgi:regulator of RNase E activity RraB
MISDLYDHEIDAMDKGPVKWMQQMQGTRMDLETFRKTAIGKFAEVGFKVDVKAWTTNDEGTVAFDIDIIDRIEKHEFDFDRQVHEVVNNYLNDPDAETGFIKTDMSKLHKPHSH